MRVKIRLDTMKDINEFIKKTTSIPEKVSLEDNEGHCVSAKSLIGALYTLEWSEIYCNCDKDISGEILKWII